MRSDRATDALEAVAREGVADPAAGEGLRDPASGTDSSPTPSAPAAPPAPCQDVDADQTSPTARLELERLRTRNAIADARRAEREALDLQHRLAAAEASLAAAGAQAGVTAHGGEPVAPARGGRMHRLRLIGQRGRSRHLGPRSTDVAAPPAIVALPVDPRSVAARYRDTMLRSFTGQGPERAALRIVVVESGADDPEGADGRSRATALAHALGRLGYQATRVAEPSRQQLADTADVVVVADPAVDPLELPGGVVRVGYDLGEGGGPADEWDVVVGTDGQGDQVVDAIARWLRSPRVSIRLPTGSPRTANAWGDTFLARDLRAAFRDAGWPARIHFHVDWDQPAIGRDDVVVDLLGLYEPVSWHGACRVLWQISHPELASPELYQSYDLAFVASDAFAEYMAEQVTVPVRPLHQATDPRRFRPEPTGPVHELLYVANWRPGRPVLRDLLPTSHRLAVYGRGWTADRLDPALLQGEHVPNHELGGYYAAAAVVLNDHWAGMQREGFLSNRLYDASAAGAFVISDHVDGLEAEFDGGVVSYRDPQHLRRLLDCYLADPAQRRRASELAHRAVLERHTFGHRVARLVEAIEPRLRAAH